MKCSATKRERFSSFAPTLDVRRGELIEVRFYQWKLREPPVEIWRMATVVFADSSGVEVVFSNLRRDIIGWKEDRVRKFEIDGGEST
jgi:hypothetical protein